MSSKGVGSSKPPLLIDTPFLLPALGIDVDEEVYEGISKFGKYTIYYLEVCLVEAMLSITKRVGIQYKSIIGVGLESIRDTYNKLDLSPDHFLKAWEVYLNARVNYLDALLYAASLIEEIPLLTVNNLLVKKLERAGYSIDNIVFPGDI